MAARFRPLILLAASPALTLCKAGSAPANSDDRAALAQQQAPSADRRDSPPPRPSPAASPPTKADAQAILDANDRAIAENQRMIGTLQDYARADADKLDRLTASCQQKLGGDLNGTNAAPVFKCIQSSW